MLKKAYRLLRTDGAASNNNLDVLEEMRAAALLHGDQYGSTLIPAGEALRITTLSGAQALGLKDNGCLAVGNKADLICWFQQAHLIPCWDSHILCILPLLLMSGL